MIKRENMRSATTSVGIVANSAHKKRSMVRVIEVQIDGFVVWKGINPCLSSNESVKPFQNLMLTFAIIIPGVLGPIRGYIEQRIRGKSIPKIIYEIESPRVTTLFLVVVEDLVEVSSYKPTNIKVRMS